MTRCEPQYRFCPVCGGRLKQAILKSHEPARLICIECAFVFYRDPKLVACSIIDVDGRIVLLKRAINPCRGKWAAPGGYVDQGEALKSAAVRETREECGIWIRIKRLLGVYSYPGHKEVLIFYVAEYISGELTAGDESEDSRLFSRNEIPWDDLAFQSTRDALKDYYEISKS